MGKPKKKEGTAPPPLAITSAVDNEGAGETVKQLSRAAVAQVLEVTYSRVRSLQKNGLLEATQDDDGVWRFDPTHVEEIRITLHAEEVEAPRSEGALNASAFAMFEQGKSLVDVVIALEVSPVVVRKLAADYATMSKKHIIIGRRSAVTRLASGKGWTVPWDDGNSVAEMFAAWFMAARRWDAITQKRTGQRLASLPALLTKKWPSVDEPT